MKMSKRLIYAEDAIDALRNHVRGGHIILPYEYIKDIVLSLPSAQPDDEEANYWHEKANSYERTLVKLSQSIAEQPQRIKGRWIDVTKTGGAELWKCSECGELELEDSYFCPNCGADMRGNTDEV